MHNLKKRGWNLVKRCSLCYKDEEKVDHLFVHCLMSSRVWNFFLYWLAIALVFLSYFKGPFSGWWLVGMERGTKAVQRFLLGAFCWDLWKERNGRIFEVWINTPESLDVSNCNSLLLWYSLREYFNEGFWHLFWDEGQCVFWFLLFFFQPLLVIFLGNFVFASLLFLMKFTFQKIKNKNSQLKTLSLEPHQIQSSRYKKKTECMVPLVLIVFFFIIGIIDHNVFQKFRFYLVYPNRFRSFAYSGLGK